MKILVNSVREDYLSWCHDVKVRLATYGLTQKDLALFLRTDPSNVSKYLSGVIEPGLSFYFNVEHYISLFHL